MAVVAVGDGQLGELATLLHAGGMIAVGVAPCAGVAVLGAGARRTEQAIQIA
jgi:hypothetical protein